MTMNRYRRLIPAALGLATLVLAGTSVTAQEPVARFSAVAVDMLSTNPGAGTVPVNIVVTRWSTDAERDQLLTTLMEKKSDALLKALRDMPRAGSVAASGGVGFDIRFARRIQEPGQPERIVLVSDRPMSFWERRDAGRTTDYPFTVVELRMPPSGDGEGRIAVAAQISADAVNRTIVIENYNDQPLGLRAVKRER